MQVVTWSKPEKISKGEKKVKKCKCMNITLYKEPKNSSSYPESGGDNMLECSSSFDQIQFCNNLSNQIHSR